MINNYLILFFIVIAGLLLRLVVSSYYTHTNDLGLWIFWAEEINRLGFNNFFNKISWTDYLPFYFYILFILNLLFKVFNTLLLFKLPGIIADLLTGILIFLIIKKYNKKKALIFSSLYIFNPAIFANSAMWGQVDGLGALLVVASIYFFSIQKMIFLSLTLAIAFLFKPLYLISIPIFFIAQLKIDYKKTAWLLLYLIVWCFLITFPFAENIFSIPGLIIDRYTSSLGQYAYASVNAFNFWTIFNKNWTPDTNLFLSISYHTWGIAIFTFIYTSTLLFLSFFKKDNPKNFLLNLTFSLTVVYLSIFTFATRVHERHLLTALPLLLIISFQNYRYLFVYITLSFIYLFNLYFGIQFLYTNGGFVFDNYQVQIFSAITVLFAIFIFVNFLKQTQLDQSLVYKIFKYFPPLFNESVPLKKQSKQTTNIDPYRGFVFMSVKFTVKKLLIILLIASFAIRLFQLNNPNAYVFDEVYHAFTAKEYLKGSTAAWEWWTTPPPGVAYEWTHPPLAKEFMSLSMIITNSTDAWGWRLLGVVFGTVNIFLLFLLTKDLFKNDGIGLVAAYIYAFDGLSFVQSRTGMNDIYLMTFVLLTLIFFNKQKYLISAICFGLALSSKWTALYLLPIIVLLLIYQKNYYSVIFDFKTTSLIKNTIGFISSFFWYLLIPPIIYLLTYVPFFLQGHNFDTFIQLQQQMWWYHTGLEAIHNYSSPWWSWPLNLYPVWYYVNYKGDSIGNIFASGNPVVFWLGFSAIFLTIWDFSKKRSFALFLILIGYFLFWLPWAFSPRIMFLYHYTPTLPFLSMALAFQLDQLSRSKTGIKIFTIVLILIGISFFLLYPFLTATPIHKTLVSLFFLTNITTNPFQ